MTAKDTLKKYITDTGEGWHGVKDDRSKQRSLSMIKQRLFKSPETISEDLCHKTLLDLGFKMVSEPEYVKQF
jgi:hypothetical protein